MRDMYGRDIQAANQAESVAREWMGRQYEGSAVQKNLDWRRGRTTGVKRRPEFGKRKPS